MSTEETPTPAAGPAPDSTAESAKGEPRDPEQIKAEIQETREELGETVAALAEKADVKAQARKKVSETKATAQEKVAEVTGTAKAKAGEFSEKAQGATPESANAAARQGAQAARGNPVPTAAAGALFLGFLLGWLLGRR